MEFLHNYNLRAHNTFGIDARCNMFADYATADEAKELALWLKENNRAGMPLLIIGGGSNLLLTQDFPGIVIHSVIHGLQVSIEGDEVFVRAGSGMEWDTLVARCVSNGWYGLENLSLIPGDVGASAVQNIGAYGTEACDTICRIEAVDLKSAQTVTIDASDCAYGYRDSRFKHEWHNRFLITHVTYRLSRRFTPLLDYGNIRSCLAENGLDHPTAQQLRDVIIDIRRNKLPDPKIQGNAGSFFMNPVVERSKFDALQLQYPQIPHYPIDALHEKIPAAWLIEQCGWKGRSQGNAGVHERQPLVLVNRGGACGKEIVQLCEAIRTDVRQRFDIEITPEVNIV
ncbi:MAG: UDP-N-acetylmuramate dehydrogenase [Prevotella sp.]|nr:UDP-N-acetylmuramate dehydrogenase [Prevotella sp.]